MKKYFILLLLIAVAFAVWDRLEPSSSAIEESRGGSEVLAEAFANHRSDIQAQQTGIVTKPLPDETEGSRHQRFILRLPSDQTILVAHNIDLAPRIPALKAGDSVTFSGEYEWNDRGGVVHWTHRDPDGRHPAGWLKHAGKTYQ